MIQLGLTGYPLGHSLSPAIHKAALSACNLEGEYFLFPIPPDDRQGLAELLSRLRRGDITGLNVTIPHKQNVIDYLDDLTPTARSIGAVNTIYRREGKLIGENTDAPGFLLDLLRFLVKDGQPIENKNALVLGAGGSARAVAYSLLNDGWNISLAARRLEQARQLANSLTTTTFHLPVTVIELSMLRTYLDTLISPASLLVNTTPVGMSPGSDESPWPVDLPLPPRAAIYDLVYNPRETKLVSDARRQRLSATTGLGMLVEQAALAFKIWTGRDPSREVMFEAVSQPLITNNQSLFSNL